MVSLRLRSEGEKKRLILGAPYRKHPYPQLCNLDSSLNLQYTPDFSPSYLIIPLLWKLDLEFAFKIFDLTLSKL